MKTSDEHDAATTEALESEREFLLRSLDDLDNERAAGNIDDATYERLHADYTARAAAVLRRLRDGIDVAVPEAPPVPPRRRWLAIGAIAVFAITAALLLVQSVHQRTPGSSLTGNDQGQQSVASLKRAAEQHPNDYTAQVTYARALLGNDLTGAVKAYDAAAKLDPKQPEPIVYGAWIRALVAGQVTSPTDRKALIDDAMRRFNAAAKLAPKYPDTYVFRGLAEQRVLNDPKAAAADFQRFLRFAPANHPMRAVVEGAAAAAHAAAATTTTKP